jgi:hypothetical protein
MKHYIFYLPLFFIFISCVKDKPEPLPAIPAEPVAAARVYVLNEGNYGSGNASLTLYDPVTGNVVKDYFAAQNQSALGDVAQSMLRQDAGWMIVVNNSKKIVACDRSMKKTGEISGLASPRYIQPVSGYKAYVSDLTAQAIHIVDPVAKTKTGSISCGDWTEKMLALNGEVFVSGQRRGYLYVINTATDKITDSIFTGPFTGGLVMDKHSKIWALSQGDQAASASGRLTKIDPATRKAELVITFKPAEMPSGLCLNKGGDTLYYLNAGICRMPVSDSDLPLQPLVSAGTRMFYGLAVSPDHLIYVSDALDYTQSSVIYIYNSEGVEKTFFKAGVNAGGFYFE